MMHRMGAVMLALTTGLAASAAQAQVNAAAVESPLHRR